TPNLLGCASSPASATLQPLDESLELGPCDPSSPCVMSPPAPPVMAPPAPPPPAPPVPIEPPPPDELDPVAGQPLFDAGPATRGQASAPSSTPSPSMSVAVGVTVMQSVHVFFVSSLVSSLPSIPLPPDVTCAPSA